MKRLLTDMSYFLLVVLISGLIVSPAVACMAVFEAEAAIAVIGTEITAIISYILFDYIE